MKRIFISFLLLLPMNLIAPAGERAVIVPAGTALFEYNISDPFLRSVIRFESNYRADAVNPFTGARGVLQILPVMIREVNKFSDVKYTWEDAWDVQKSIDMWYLIMKAKNPEYYYDRACRLWFGSGVQKHDGMTWCDYYQKVMN